MNGSYDYIIVGAGLQGGLLSLAINHYQPEASILLVDDGDQVGGNHTWSFHQGDIPDCARIWLDAVISSRWSGYSVRFPQLERRVDIPYASINSYSFGKSIERRFGFGLTTSSAGIRSDVASTSHGKPVVQSSRHEINTALVDQQSTLQNAGDSHPASRLRLLTTVDDVASDAIWIEGEKIVGKVIVDCRGPNRAELHSVGHCGYQKFYGFEIELADPWPSRNPILMDSLVNQADGFGFMYTLPFARHRVLVEHTQFSDHRELCREDCLASVSDYIAQQTESDWQVIREESGCLPMPWNQALMPAADVPLKGGYAGGWFHAATGYSLPLAVRWADTVAKTPAGQVADAVKDLASEHQSQAKRARFLNRLLFRLVKPERRYEIFQRFYRVLSDPAIARFYAHQFTGRDLARILIGRPPSRLTPLQFINSFVTER